MHTIDGAKIHILHPEPDNLHSILIKNRNITDERVFFDPIINDISDPFLMPDIQEAVRRIMKAYTHEERIVVFGDYDADGVSSTAILVKFLTTLGCHVSYRLPHRAHDGYGLKKYFIDELGALGVKLIITVDCGTRDIEVIAHAKSLGMDVIVTDHHSVPSEIPVDVPILNPKRSDSKYPFQSLAGAGVAFQLVHALLSHLEKNTIEIPSLARYKKEDGTLEINTLLQEYLEFAVLGTIADCMPLRDDNRIIAILGLRALAHTRNHGLKKLLSTTAQEIEGNADIVGFQIGPRINAAGRMDSPIKALQWLLSGKDRAHELTDELEELNSRRQSEVTGYLEDALLTVNTENNILIYVREDITHGLIGLVAGKLTESFSKPSIVLKREGDEMIASCRSPEWCDIIPLLDACRDLFSRYGGHRQAAGFTIPTENFEIFQSRIEVVFREKYNSDTIPESRVSVECRLAPEDITQDNLNIIERFKPFGIGNTRPQFLIENLTLERVEYLGREQKHLALYFREIPSTKVIAWKWGEKKEIFTEGEIFSLVAILEGNDWNGKRQLQLILKNLASNT